jgi:nucleobase:cation symporter-1, NCS1 family
LPAIAAFLWACFLGFWLLNMVVVWRGVESIRHLQAFGAPFMFVMAAALLIWVRDEGWQLWHDAFDAEPVPLDARVSRVFFPSLTAMVGYWATLALNIPDFTRYSKSQSAQSWGQAFGLPVAMVLYTFVGISVTSASTVLFGHPIWNPILLIGAFHQPVVAFIALIAILIATLNVNIGANVVSPSNDFSNLYPRLISFRTGGLITGFLGLAMCPWKLLATPDAYIFGWLVGYSGLLGPVAGSWSRLLSDPQDGAGRELALSSRGRVPLHEGRQSAGDCVALVLGVVRLRWSGGVKPLHFLYDYAWFVGFFTAGFVCGDDEGRGTGCGASASGARGRSCVIATPS